MKAVHSVFSQNEPINFNDFWIEHKDRFNTWLQFKDISKRTKQNYSSSLARFFENNAIHKPNEFRGLQLKDKEARSLRNLINYCEDEEIENVCGFSIEKWRRFIKIKKSGAVEIYVTDEEIKEAYEACPEEIKPIYSLLVYSGNRLTHIHKMLEMFNEHNIIIDGNIAYYPTASLLKGTKRTFQVFLPASYIPRLKKIGKLRSYDNITKNIRYGRVSVKTIRKWHLNFMIKEGVTESLADFIQGRAPATVGSAHYLNKVEQARVEYAKMIDQFPI